MGEAQRDSEEDLDEELQLGYCEDCLTSGVSLAMEVKSIDTICQGEAREIRSL